MTILGQIREEASIQANAMPLEILELAQKNLTKTRFERLRKKKAYPTTEQERAYIHALNEYVFNKMKMKRIEHNFPLLGRPAIYWSFKEEAGKWRSEMDSIEYNLYRPNVYQDRSYHESEPIVYKAPSGILQLVHCR